MAMATLWMLWPSTRLLYDGLLLGAAVAGIASSCALAFASAVTKAAKPGSSASSSCSSSSSSSSASASAILLRTVAISSDCAECTALLRFYSPPAHSPPMGYGATLLAFGEDSLLTETVMSFTVSFIIVTFAVFLVRELR